MKYPQNIPANSREYKAGELYDLPDDHARRWIRRGVAVEVTADDKPAKKSKAEAMVPAPPAKGA